MCNTCRNIWVGEIMKRNSDDIVIVAFFLFIIITIICLTILQLAGIR